MAKWVAHIIPHSFSYRHEIGRKLFHLSSLWMVVVLYYCDRVMAAGLFGALLMPMLAYEYLRERPYRLASLFDPFLRPHETGKGSRLTGATHVLLAAFACTMLFPRSVAAIVLAMMLVGDSAAALVGRHWGKRRLYGKSPEGCAAFFVSALLIALALNHSAFSDFYSVAELTTTAFAAMLAEVISGRLGIDDNFGVPFAAALVLWLFSGVPYA